MKNRTIRKRLLLFLGLITVTFLCACSPQSHNCEEPEIYKTYDLTADGDTVYFNAYDKVWSHQPGDKEPTELAQFRGLFFNTPHGVYCFDEYCADNNTPDLYQVQGNELIPVGNLPEEARRLTILDVVDGVIYWSSMDTIWTEKGEDLVPTYRTDCATGETTVLFAAPDIQRPERMADGKLWFTAKGGIFQYYDLETGETVTYCNAFWSYLAEPYTVFYYEDFILCYCIQYAVNEAGTYGVTGYCYYRLDYGSSQPVFLSDYTWHSNRPWLLDNTLYFPGYGEGDIYLVALDAQTGQLTQLTQERFIPEELAVTRRGFYYTENYDLYCYDYATEKIIRLVDKQE
ncbi:MAG: hypothetical protein IKU62_07785 [Ruminiclostridium sp.]|nr:hypothetical protein [Ruminiclostridium sp.]